VIVVLVHQRNSDVTGLDECSSATQPGEAATHNHDVRFWTLCIQCMTSYLVGVTITLILAHLAVKRALKEEEEIIQPHLTQCRNGMAC
jgi:hypothetical protein